MSTVALFTAAKMQMQPKCSLTDECIKMCYIYTTEYYSAKKNNKTMPFAAIWVDLDIILSELSHKKTKAICYHLQVESNI